MTSKYVRLISAAIVAIVAVLVSGPVRVDASGSTYYTGCVSGLQHAIASR